jgi:hypothetical protein
MDRAGVRGHSKSNTKAFEQKGGLSKTVGEGMGEALEGCARAADCRGRREDVTKRAHCRS